MSRSTIKSLLLLLLVMVLFYWRILLTGQFSLLTESEGVNQGYSWYQFWITTVRRGIWPLWDPYTFSGHIFAGEMQTAAFYPLNFLVALAPFNQHGVRGFCGAVAAFRGPNQVAVAARPVFSVLEQYHESHF